MAVETEQQRSPTDQMSYSLDRRALLKRAGALGVGLTVFGLLGTGRTKAQAVVLEDRKPDHKKEKSLDARIITAAATAEALACTMYYNIIASPIYGTDLSANTNDQAYLVAAFEQEVDHFELLVGAGGVPLAETFYFPVNMFSDPQTTVNTLITLEDAFIAAYLLGVRRFTKDDLKELAAQIMGVECEHRALGRVIAADLGLTATTGSSGEAEEVNGPNFSANNLAYERTFNPPLSDIQDVVQALGPFVSPGAAGFSSTPYPLMLSLPSGVSPVTLANTSP